MRLFIVLLVIFTQPLTAQLRTGLGWFKFIDQAGNPDKPIRVWYYRPKKFNKILFAMHGEKRNGRTALGPWQKLADEQQLLVLAPEFSRQHYYGIGRYSEGNVILNRQRVVKKLWSFSLIEHLFQELNRALKTDLSGYYMYGSREGANFIQRMIMLLPSASIKGAALNRLSSPTMPDYSLSYPRGLKNTVVDDIDLRQAFSRKVVVYDHRVSSDAVMQFFINSEARAQQLNIPFRWQRTVLNQTDPAIVTVLFFAGKPLEKIIK